DRRVGAEVEVEGVEVEGQSVPRRPDARAEAAAALLDAEPEPDLAGAAAPLEALVHHEGEAEVRLALPGGEGLTRLGHVVLGPGDRALRVVDDLEGPPEVLLGVERDADRVRAGAGERVPVEEGV